MEEVLHIEPLQVVVWFIPFGFGGMILPTIASLFLHLVPGTLLLTVSSLAWVAAPLLISFLTRTTSYWSLAFPAMICATMGIDITYSVTNIWITTAVVERRQGLAAALIHSLLFLSNSFFLGFGDVLHSRLRAQGRDARQAYQIVLWYVAGVAGVALVLFALFVRVGKAGSDLTADEKALRAAKEQGAEKQGATKG